MSKFAMLTVIVAAIFLARNIDGHGIMVKPTNWFDFKQYLPYPKPTYDFVGMKSGLQCYVGCAIPKDIVCPGEQSCEGKKRGVGCACMWYTNNTIIKHPTLFDSKYLTYEHGPYPEKKLYHPWRAPGAAPIDSPCGVAGGNLHGCIGGKCNRHKGGFGFGPKAEEVKFPYKFVSTDWKRGEDVEVAWSITANHGGGYSYRLCKLPQEGVSTLTEECFQQIPLDFVGDKQWVQYGEDESTRRTIPAVRVKEGTFPDGSHWTKNPIPACIGGLGGFYYPTAECPEGTQFQPPKPDLYGFGVNSAHNITNFQFSIVDRVHIPINLQPGDYVLSFRWDCEQTPQVWNTCSNIRLS